MVLTSVIVLLVAMTRFAGMTWWFLRLGRRRVGMLSPIRTSPFRDPTPCLGIGWIVVVRSLLPRESL